MLVRSLVILSGAVLATACVPEQEKLNINDRGSPYSCAEMVELDPKGVDVQIIDKALLPERTRIIPPGTAVTMDYIPDRLNLEVDDQGLITRVYCG